MGNFPFAPPGVAWGAGEPLTSGEAVIARAFTANDLITLASGQLSLTYWTAAKTEACGHVTTYTSSTAAASLTYAAVGIYTMDAAGDLTLAASTANLEGSMWATAFTAYQESLTAPFAKVAGSRYALGVLAVGTTPPALAGISPSAFAFTPPYTGAELTGQTVLPASIPAGSLSGGPTGTLMPQAIVAP